MLLLGTLFWGISLWVLLRRDTSGSTRGVTALAGLVLLLAWITPMLNSPTIPDRTPIDPPNDSANRVVIQVSGMT